MPTTKHTTARTKTGKTRPQPEKAAGAETSAAKGTVRKAAPKPAKPEAVAATSPVQEAQPKNQPQPRMQERIFALDIGTRSVIGIVADCDTDGVLHILGTTRQEHTTRAMLDGQIHDVVQVSDIIRRVKAPLDEQFGPLRTAAVAAAGRALYTMTADAEVDIDGIISVEQQRNLDFAGVQAAQNLLAESQTIDDPTRYYCVGYSTIRYLLDDIQLKSLIGQRGKKAKATVIATFLPRQVIDSMQSALQTVDLEMRALTLEPIAAINVLIPPTMRHLNLVLVDIGAGTSDIAITKDGSIIAYGMVPLAGDEITEAISQKFLLDFNVAEKVKRAASQGEKARFTDILGVEYELAAEEVIDPVMPNIENLANAIAKQVLELNTEAPQALMLAGGGSLTPHLQECVAKALDMPLARVAVRHPDDQVVGITDIPGELQRPDAVTPLGILKIASLNTLHFLTVFVNDTEYSLFNFRELTVTDALLNAGINLKKYNGRPGLGLVVELGTERKSFPGTMGTMAKLELNGKEADLGTIIHDGDHLKIIPGKNGNTPTVYLGDLVTAGREYTIYVNGRETQIRQKVLVNGEEASLDRLLADGDVIENRDFKSLGEALLAAGYPPQGRKISYKLNGVSASYSCKPEILVEDVPALISQPVHEGDHVDYIITDEPKLGDILNENDLKASISIYYEGDEFQIPVATTDLMVNGRKASPGTILFDGCDIAFHKSQPRGATVSDALLAVGFQPPAATSHVTFAIMVNGRPVDFADPIKNGDTLTVEITPLGGTPAPANKAEQAVSASGSEDAAKIEVPGLPGLTVEASPTQKAQASGKKLTLDDFIRHD